MDFTRCSVYLAVKSAQDVAGCQHCSIPAFVLQCACSAQSHRQPRTACLARKAWTEATRTEKGQGKLPRSLTNCYHTVLCKIFAQCLVDAKVHVLCVRGFHPRSEQLLIPFVIPYKQLLRSIASSTIFCSDSMSCVCRPRKAVKTPSRKTLKQSQSRKMARNDLLCELRRKVDVL